MYSLTIVGGGAISSGYDSPQGKIIKTHINGALKHSNINLDAVIEVNMERQQYIRKKWGESFEIFSDIDKSIEKYKSDIVIIATPTNTHFNIINQLLVLHKPKLIICEKPIVSNYSEFKKLNNLLNEKNVKILTHYTRRFDPSINELKNIIQDCGVINHFYGTFAKGLFHNGSHLIDLVSLIISPVNDISSISQNIVNNDIFGKFLLKTESCDGIICNIDNNKLSIFELTIYTQKAKIEIRGPSQEITIHYISDNGNSSGFKSFSKKKTLINTLDKYAYNLFEYSVNIINNENKYNMLKSKQFFINKLIFETQEKLLENY